MQPSTRTSREAKPATIAPRVYRFTTPQLTRSSIVVDGNSGWTAEQHEVLGSPGVLFVYNRLRSDAKAVFVPWQNIASVECSIERTSQN